MLCKPFTFEAQLGYSYGPVPPTGSATMDWQLSIRLSTSQAWYNQASCRVVTPMSLAPVSATQLLSKLCWYAHWIKDCCLHSAPAAPASYQEAVRHGTHFGCPSTESVSFQCCYHPSHPHWHSHLHRALCQAMTTTCKDKTSESQPLSFLQLPSLMTDGLSCCTAPHTLYLSCFPSKHML